MADIEILDMDAPDFIERFSKALGVKPGDTLEIMTPQFERTDGIAPITNPGDLFKILHSLPEPTLKAIGMAPWDGRLWLLPYQWFNKIPLGFMLTCIDGTEEPFNPDTTDDDMRFGMLAYGIVPSFAKSRKPIND